MTGSKSEALKWLIDAPDGDYEILPYKPKRSRDANALLWACISDLGKVLRADNMSVYCQLLKRYSKPVCVAVTQPAFEELKSIAGSEGVRTLEEADRVVVGGKELIKVLVWTGSHTMNTAEFSRLLDGVISEMQEVGIAPPMRKDVEEALKRYAAQHDKSGRNKTEN